MTITRMEWLAKLLREGAISKLIVTAAFVASAVMWLGPFREPDLIPRLPAIWQVVAAGVFVFCATLLALWGARALCKTVAGAWGAIVRHHASRGSLTPHEHGLLLTLAKRPNDAIHLKEFDHATGAGSLLEATQIASELARRGLVTQNSYDRELITLTDSGRVRALDLQRLLRAQREPE